MLEIIENELRLDEKFLKYATGEELQEIREICVAVRQQESSAKSE